MINYDFSIRTRGPLALNLTSFLFPLLSWNCTQKRWETTFAAFISAEERKKRLCPIPFLSPITLSLTAAFFMGILLPSSVRVFPNRDLLKYVRQGIDDQLLIRTWPGAIFHCILFPGNCILMSNQTRWCPLFERYLVRYQFLSGGCDSRSSLVHSYQDRDVYLQVTSRYTGTTVLRIVFHLLPTGFPEQTIT